MTFSYGVFTVFGLKGAFQYSNYEKFSTDCLLTVTGISFAYPSIKTYTDAIFKSNLCVDTFDTFVTIALLLYA